MSAASPKLYLPGHMAGVAKSRGHQVRPQLQLRESPGRKVGATEGGWISDLVETCKAIVLCWACKPKFDHKVNHYYKDEKFPYCQGVCDGCRKYAVQGQLYVHESFLTGPGGKTTSGQTWTPR